MDKYHKLLVPNLSDILRNYIGVNLARTIEYLHLTDTESRLPIKDLDEDIQQFEYDEKRNSVFNFKGNDSRLSKTELGTLANAVVRLEDSPFQWNVLTGDTVYVHPKDGEVYWVVLIVPSIAGNLWVQLYNDGTLVYPDAP